MDTLALSTVLTCVRTQDSIAMLSGARMRSGDLLTSYLCNKDKLEPPKQWSDHRNGPQATQGAHGTLCSRVNTVFRRVTKKIEIQEGGDLRTEDKT